VKTLLWLWIFGFTAAVFLFPPMEEKFTSAQPKPNVQWKGIPPLRQSVFHEEFRETRMDFPRLLAVLLAVNFLPAVAIWKWPEISSWASRHKKRLIIAAVSLFVLAFALSGYAAWAAADKARRDREWDELCRKNMEERKAAAQLNSQARLRPGYIHLSPSPSPAPRTAEPEVRRAIPVNKTNP